MTLLSRMDIRDVNLYGIVIMLFAMWSIIELANGLLK